MGQLWEQYFLYERIKYNGCRGYHPQYYFWRTYDQQELDLVEINSRQEMAAFERKWTNQKSKAPLAFKKAYPQAVFNGINRFNYLDFISGQLNAV